MLMTRQVLAAVTVVLVSDFMHRLQLPADERLWQTDSAHPHVSPVF